MTQSTKMSLRRATSLLCGLGITIRRNEYNEYRVNFRAGKEATAYYTNDIDDAYSTGLLMAQRRRTEIAMAASNAIH